MIDSILSFISQGFVSLPWWGYGVVALVLTHITIVSVTVYLHRHQAHRALELNPLVSHFFRFWLWLTTGMITAEWVGIHRKHHAACETVDDPHSPKILGIDKVLWEGVELYRAATKDRASIEKYRHGTPDDWIERHLYAKYPTVGVALVLIINVLLFGAMGLSIWAIQMLWIPLFAAGVINGLGHWWGYRNFESRDMSTNVSPFGILIGGEELHNNHHAFPSSAKLSARWWEFDIGWMYIRMLELLHLARIKKVNRRPQIVPGKVAVDMDTVRAVILNPLHVMAHYARAVIQPVLRDEWQCAGESCRRRFRQTRWLLVREASLMDSSMSQHLEKVLAQYQKIRLVYQFRQQLQVVWSKRAESQEQLRQSLHDWCLRAEATGIQSLEEFARRLRGYSVQAV